MVLMPKVPSVRVHILHVYSHSAFLVVWTQRTLYNPPRSPIIPEDLVPGPSIRSPAIALELLPSSNAFPDLWLSVGNFGRAYQLSIYHDSSRLHR